MTEQTITSGPFKIIVLSRLLDTNQPITVYLEGDVRDWVPAAPPGTDNTPDEELGLRLAKIDPADNVIFIAHPCQFGIDDFICYGETWEKGRLAQQSLDSINRALTYALASVPHPQLNLVGYSGGGAIAALLAARRHDVISLRTIAANLDPNGNGRTHVTEPRDDFIDPMLISPRLASLPQEHFVGDKDVFVPPFLTENFVNTMGRSFCVKVTHVPEATHRTGWEQAWKQYSMTFPTCGPRPPR